MMAHSQEAKSKVKNPNSILVHSVMTGIWQTVWLEVLPQTYIASTKQTPDVDSKVVRVAANVDNLLPGDQLSITAWDGTEKIAEQQ